MNATTCVPNSYPGCCANVLPVSTNMRIHNVGNVAVFMAFIVCIPLWDWTNCQVVLRVVLILGKRKSSTLIQCLLVELCKRVTGWRDTGSKFEMKLNETGGMPKTWAFPIVYCFTVINMCFWCVTISTVPWIYNPIPVVLCIHASRPKLVSLGWQLTMNTEHTLYNHLWIMWRRAWIQF